MSYARPMRDYFFVNVEITRVKNSILFTPILMPRKNTQADVWSEWISHRFWCRAPERWSSSSAASWSLCDRWPSLSEGTPSPPPAPPPATPGRTTTQRQQQHGTSPCLHPRLQMGTNQSNVSGSCIQMSVLIKGFGNHLAYFFEKETFLIFKPSFQCTAGHHVASVKECCSTRNRRRRKVS